MTILIPAYEPTSKLIQLIDKLISTANYSIIVVDDGSGYEYEDVFLEAKKRGCTVLTHFYNLGKGEALKMGLKFVKESNEKEGVISVDCDGQHLVHDIDRVSKSVFEQPGKIVLGCRRFTGKIPMKSLFGNTITRTIYRLLSGNKLTDTQTGLRGFSIDMIDWLCHVNGTHFEYEMNMLLDAHGDGIELFPIEIETVYFNENKSTHFRPIVDAVKVYLPLLKFSISSILSGIVDFALVIILQVATSKLFLTVVIARFISACFNYTLNKFLVFGGGNKLLNHSVAKYFVLACGTLLLNYEMLHILNEVYHVPIFFAKLFTEISIFIFSYTCQYRFIFKQEEKEL